MEELKALFGDEAIDFATFQAKLAENAETIKLANLVSGKYVDTSKYDKLKGQFDKWKTDNDVSKFADYDKIKTERDALKAEKVMAEQTKKVQEYGVDERFVGYVISEVGKNVTEQKSFDDALKEFVETNSQFVTTRMASFQRVNTSNPLGGNGNSAMPSTNQIMNNLLRGIK